MADDFAITYSIERRDSPLEFDAHYGLSDATQVFVAYRRFVAFHTGEFSMRIGDLRLRLSLEVDLSVVFNHVPQALWELTRDSEKPSWLFFFEQGTDLGLYLHRRGDVIRITFLEGSHKTALSNSMYEVNADEFLQQWVTFMDKVLDAMAAFQPEIASDASYREYRAALARAHPFPS